MGKHEVSPDAIAEALALREAGYTALSISQRLGISIRTLQRHFASTKTRKGIIKADVFEKAKADMLARVGCDKTIKEEAAKLIADDLAHSIHLRELILAASDQMKAANLADAVQVMRAAAAYSTAIKNTSDIIRHSLRLDQLADDALSAPPELQVRELTQDEVLALQARLSKPEEETGDEDTAVATSI